MGISKIKKRFKTIVEFIFNPRLLFCFGIAWMITNGWSYVMLGIGIYYGIAWMIATASAYLTFLWLPISPEKIVTVAIAIALLRWLFPKDTKTLGVLKQLMRKTKDAFRSVKEKRKKKHIKKQYIK